MILDPIRICNVNFIKIDVIQGKIQLFESISDVIEVTICFIGLTPGTE